MLTCRKCRLKCAVGLFELCHVVASRLCGWQSAPTAASLYLSKSIVRDVASSSSARVSSGLFGPPRERSDDHKWCRCCRSSTRVAVCAHVSMQGTRPIDAGNSIDAVVIFLFVLNLYIDEWRWLGRTSNRISRAGPMDLSEPGCGGILGDGSHLADESVVAVFVYNVGRNRFVQKMSSKQTSRQRLARMLGFKLVSFPSLAISMTSFPT